MKIKKFRSLSFRLTLWYIIILGGTIFLAWIFLYQGVKDGLLDELDVKLLEIADEANDAWRRERGKTWEEAIQETEREFKAYRPFIQVVTLKERGGRGIDKIITSERLEKGIFTFNLDIYYRADRADIKNLVYETFKQNELGASPVRFILFPVRGPTLVQVGITLSETENALRRLLIFMVLAGGLLMLLASLGGNFIIRKALKPVKSVVHTAKEISADDLSLRIESDSRQDEIGELVDTFNDMISRLEASIKKIKQFSGDVSHELRTPLTVIRGEVEVLLRKERSAGEYREALNTVLEESSLLERIIDDLLFLSRIDALEKNELEKSVQLDEILLKTIESREAAAQNKSVQLDIQNIDPAAIKGEENLLERMLANIIDNAIRYTSAQGKVEILLETKKDDVILSIRDNGIGIPEEALPYIYDRFYVADKSRSKETGGLGLGLSIAKHVADTHNATIEVESQIDQGTTFRIHFLLLGRPS